MTEGEELREAPKGSERRSAIPAQLDGSLLHTLVLCGDPFPTLGLLHHVLSVQQAEAIQVAH